MLPYFAYGSNMDFEQMRSRCPDAVGVGVALLEGYRLAFTRFSPKRACGVADVIPAAGERVWGVLYQLTERDLEQLDRSEGYREGRDERQNGYNRVTLEVTTPQGERVSAQVYVVPLPGRKAEADCLPNKAYMGHLLDGARYWGLPEAYVRGLERLEIVV